MADRYFHVDVDFMFKNTTAVLLDEFGYAGPVVWLALIARAKEHRPVGEFSWTSEADAWQQLFGPNYGRFEVEFTFDDFLKVTGRLKQTRRAKRDQRRRGRVANVALTQYGRWQKDARRFSERERMRRKRAQNTANDSANSDANDVRTGSERVRTPRARTRTTPPTPPNEKNGTHPHDCPRCGARQPSKSALEDHVRIFHDEAAEPVAASVLEDEEIPF